jgi:NitT/TauT family transport system permease protein
VAESFREAHVAGRLSWFGIRTPLAPRRAVAAKFGAFLLPLAVWCLVSYVPFVWHPKVLITDPGDSTTFRQGQRPDRADFNAENAELVAHDKRPAVGVPANPIYLPAPHEVALAFYTSLTTPPPFRDIPWLHQSLWHSCQIIFWGFVFSAIIGVPLGVLCGTFDLFSKLTEPFIDFIRYMPAPAFGALCVAVLGIYDGPKIAIIWIGTFFQMVLVVANTTRQVDPGLLEAAQTLGATRRSLLTKVILPSILPNLYNDMRILLGWAWTYLIVAEVGVGTSSGISNFIYKQGHYQQYQNVFAGIIMIGLIGFFCDQVLAFIGGFLFPWQPKTAKGGLMGGLIRGGATLSQWLFKRRPVPGTNGAVLATAGAPAAKAGP